MCMCVYVYVCVYFCMLHVVLLCNCGDIHTEGFCTQVSLSDSLAIAESVSAMIRSPYQPSGYHNNDDDDEDDDNDDYDQPSGKSISATVGGLGGKFWCVGGGEEE